MSTRRRSPSPLHEPAFGHHRRPADARGELEEPAAHRHAGQKEPGALPALQHGGYPADEPRISPELQALAVGEHLRAALPDGATFDGVLVWRSPRAQMLLLANPRSGACMAMSLRAAAELAASGKLTLGRATLAERTAERVLARESGA